MTKFYTFEEKVEALKNDLNIWNEFAPEEATHFGISSIDTIVWYMECNNGVFQFNHDGDDVWMECPVEPSCDPKPQSKDGTVFPEVGKIYEARVVGTLWDGIKARILGINEDTNEIWMHLSCQDSSAIYRIEQYQFRPYKSVREELMKTLFDGMDAGTVADSILNRFDIKFK